MDKLKQLKEVLDIINKDYATTEDVAGFFKALLSAFSEARTALNKQITDKLATVRNGLDGRDGKNGKDGKDGAQGPEGRQGLAGESIIGPQGPAGKDGSPDMAEDIRNKLELLDGDERLKIEAIKDLREELDELKKLRTSIISGGGGNVGGNVVRLHDLSADLNGVLKTFALPAFWRITLVTASSFPNALRPTVDYTVDAAAMTITFTNEIDAAVTLTTGQTVLVQYATTV